MEPCSQYNTDLQDLPESCISLILSFTTPPDACRLSAVSKLFRSAAHSDSLWNNWLPRSYNEVLSQAVSVIPFSSKKELYLRFCESIVLRGGTKIFWLDPSTAKICYMLSAREMSILGDPRQLRWSWRPGHEAFSRFEEVPHLVRVFHFEIRGQFDCRRLSSNTEYTLSFLIKAGVCPMGSGASPVEFRVTTPEGDEMNSSYLLSRKKGASMDPNMRIAPLIHREHGWVEVLAGKFMTKEYSRSDAPKYIEFTMKEVASWWSKTDVFLDGVMIKPKSSSRYDRFFG
uniref:F-box domain-containing protein n=1 Tax=Araucaria cunninghamii TaxID=56994 RepID=A0A0D6QRX0_ARACU